LNAQVTTLASNNLLNAQVTTPEAQTDSLADARLKKKEVNKQDKGSKRRVSWTERQHRGKTIGPTTIMHHYLRYMNHTLYDSNVI
jgi:hypothetical protein